MQGCEREGEREGQGEREDVKGGGCAQEEDALAQEGGCSSISLFVLFYHQYIIVSYAIR